MQATEQIPESITRRRMPWLRGTKLLYRLLSGDFTRKVLDTSATRVALIGIGLLTTIAVVRGLGPEGRGFYAVALAVGMLGQQFGVLGLHVSNTHFVAKNPSHLPELLGNTLAVSLVIGGLTLAGPYLIFAAWPGLAPIHGALLILALAWIPLSIAYLLTQSLLLGIGEVKLYNRTELTNRALALGIIAGLIVLRQVDPTKVFAAGLFTMTAMLAVILVHLVKMAGRFPKPSWAIFQTTMGYGLRAYLAALFCFVVIRADVLMLKYLRGAVDSGYYSIAVNMSDYIVLLPTIIALLLLPKLSAIAEIKEKYRVMKRITMGVMAVETPLLLLSVLFAPMVVRIMFGSAFASSVPAYLWMVPGLFFISIHTLSVTFLNSIGCPMEVVWIWLGCAILKVLFNLWVIPRYGIQGTAFASSFCYFIATACVWWVARRKLRSGVAGAIPAEEPLWIADSKA